MAREFFKNLPSQETPFNASRWNGLLNGEEAMGSIVVDDITCKNMLDYNNSEYGYYGADGTNNTGSVASHVNRISDYINVDSDKEYTASANQELGYIMINEFDENKNWLKRTNLNNVSTNTITTSSTTKYIRVSFNIDNAVDMTITKLNEIEAQIEKGPIATKYTPYKKIGYNSQESMGEIVVDDITCKNLANIEDVKVNGSEEFSKTIYDIKPNKEYTISCIKSRISGVAITQQTIWGIRKITFYDKNGTNLSAISGTTILLATNSSKKCSLTFTTPSNTSYIECRFDNNNGDANLNTLVSKVQLEPGSIATDYVEHKEYENKVLYSTSEQVIGTWTDGKPLYRKTISINTPLTTNNTEVYNFDTNFIIKNFYGFVTISASSQLIPINFYFTNEYNVATYITKNTGKINMKVGSEAYTNQQVTISLEYTKTTD